MRKIYILALLPAIILLCTFCKAVPGKSISYYTRPPVEGESGKESLPGADDTEDQNILPVNTPECKLDIPKISLDSDRDNDGIFDLDDIVEGARKDAIVKPAYKSEYYRGGYPPDHEGVCTDVIWRAFKNAGYNLKDMVDKDIRENTRDYPRVEGKPDPNIDFRRVKNLVPFFKKYATTLSIEVAPWNVENLKQWQGGDIVVFGPPLEHIAIISDIRRKDGVPYIIHNGGPYTKEEDRLLTWPSKITHHFRFPKE